MSSSHPVPPPPPPLPPPVVRRSEAEGTRGQQPLWILVFTVAALCSVLAVASVTAVLILLSRPVTPRDVADASANSLDSETAVAPAIVALPATTSQAHTAPTHREPPAARFEFPASTLSPLAEPVTAAYVLSTRNGGDAYPFVGTVQNSTASEIKWPNLQEIRKRLNAAGISPNVKLLDPWQRVPVAKALGVDYLLVVDAPGTTEDFPLHLEICEGRFGACIARQMVPVNQERFSADTTAFGNLLTTIIRQRAGAATTYYTIAPFRAAGTSDQMNADGLPDALAALALTCLPVSAGNAFVPFDYASEVEKALVGEGRGALRTYSGEYTASGNDGFQLILRLEQGGRELGKVNQRFKPRDEIVMALASLLERLPQSGPVVMPGFREPGKSAGLLAYYAKRDIANGMGAQSLAFIEAAALADPNSIENRLQCVDGYVMAAERHKPSTPLYMLRAIYHLEHYLALGGEEGTDVSGASRRQTPLKTIDKVRYLSLFARRGESDFGGGWKLDQIDQVEAALQRIITRRVNAGGDATLYVEWLVNDFPLPKKLERFADLAESVKNSPQIAAQLAKWLESKQFPKDLKNQPVWREFLVRLSRSNSPSVRTLAANFRNQLPGDEVEVLAALVKKREVRFDDQVNEAQVAGKRLQFSQWSRKDGRTAELAPMRIIGPVVEFCTRDGDLNELPINELADSDRTRLTQWQRQQEVEP